jgi:hypothetical protein
MDQSAHSRNNMGYACQLSEGMAGVDFDLYHVQPMISQYLTVEAGKNPKARNELERIYEKNRASSLAFLEECKTHMEKRSGEAVHVKTITKPNRHGIANEKCMADFIHKAGGILEKAGIEKKPSNISVSNRNFLPARRF